MPQTRPTTPQALQDLHPRPTFSGRSVHFEWARGTQSLAVEGLAAPPSAFL